MKLKLVLTFLPFLFIAYGKSIDPSQALYWQGDCLREERIGKGRDLICGRRAPWNFDHLQRRCHNFKNSLCRRQEAR